MSVATEHRVEQVLGSWAGNGRRTLTLDFNGPPPGLIDAADAAVGRLSADFLTGLAL